MSHMIGHAQHTGERPRFQVWANGNQGEHLYAVDSPEEARALIRRLAMHDLRDPSSTWNAFGLQELEGDGNYHEWYDEHDNPIDHHLFEESATLTSQ